MSMSIIDTISSIRHSCGIDDQNMSDTLVAVILRDVQDYIQDVISRSKLIRNMRKHYTLKVQDVNEALESLGHQQLLGYYSDKEPKLIPVELENSLYLLYEEKKIPIDATAKQQMVYPIAMRAQVQWLAVNGASRDEGAFMEDNNTDKSSNTNNVNNSRKSSGQDGDVFVSSKYLEYSSRNFYSLSKRELQSEDIYKREYILHLLSSKSCVRSLVPYYIKYVNVLLHDKPDDYQFMYISMSVARALIQNGELSNIGYYLHQIITIALSFLVKADILTKSPCDLVRIRDYAAEFIQYICDAFHGKYPIVQPELTRQLFSLLQMKDSSIGSKYGAFVGITAFGSEVVSQFVIPNLKTIVNDLMESGMSSGDRDTRLISKLFYEKIVSAIGKCVYIDSRSLLLVGSPSIDPKIKYVDYDSVSEIIGFQLLPYYVDNDDYLFI